MCLFELTLIVEGGFVVCVGRAKVGFGVCGGVGVPSKIAENMKKCRIAYVCRVR